MDTGAQAWNSEYSTIDSGILTSGALFCKKYFCENDSIAKYADLLWESIDWSKSIQDPTTGGIFLEMLENGEGKPGAVTLPFNEYMIVAWLAMQQEMDNPGPATELWNNHYADPLNLPTSDYQGISVLSDNPNNFLSSFVFQFPYYLCHHFTTDTDYLAFFDHARRADSLWWENENVGASYQWGLGAGSSNLPGGYHPDAINNNPTHMYSPHIIAGFLPVYQEGAMDLLELYQNGEGIYTLPNANADTILWRKSLDEPAWHSNELQGIDYSSMLLGLASLPEFLGVGFFAEFNDFFSGPCATPTGLVDISREETAMLLFPNPTTSAFEVTIDHPSMGPFTLQLFDITGRGILQRHSTKTTVKHTESLDLAHLPVGLYFLEVQIEGQRYSEVVVKE
ncbi:MAG: T9SS type A sorting domain-containing protein [Bacteroidota bacterium]